MGFSAEQMRTGIVITGFRQVINAWYDSSILQLTKGYKRKWKRKYENKNLSFILCLEKVDLLLFSKHYHNHRLWYLDWDKITKCRACLVNWKRILIFIFYLSSTAQNSNSFFFCMKNNPTLLFQWDFKITFFFTLGKTASSTHALSACLFGEKFFILVDSVLNSYPRYKTGCAVNM